jgi:hypothetical protein
MLIRRSTLPTSHPRFGIEVDGSLKKTTCRETILLVSTLSKLFARQEN